MYLPEATETSQLLPFLEEGFCFRHIKGRTCVFMQQGKIRISSGQYFAALSGKDFVLCYAGWMWTPVEKAAAVDEEKDREYYAWRREKQ